jgi:hypothetical protein
MGDCLSQPGKSAQRQVAVELVDPDRVAGRSDDVVGRAEVRVGVLESERAWPRVGEVGHVSHGHPHGAFDSL